MCTGKPTLLLYVSIFLVTCMMGSTQSGTVSTCDASGSSNDSGSPLRIAFIGNSLTYYNDLPHLVQALLSEDYEGPNSKPSQNTSDDDIEGALKYEGQSAIVGACLRGGASFGVLWEKGADMKEAKSIGGRDMFPTVEALLREPSGWDVVVMQDYSQAPAREAGRTASMDVLQKHFVPLLLEMKTTPVVMLYQTWGYRAAAKNSEQIGGFSEMSKELAKGYAMYSEVIAQAGIETIVAPVGDAFAAVYANAPQLWQLLYQGDNYHPRGMGSFLSSSHIATSLVSHPRFAERFPKGLHIQPVWPKGIGTWNGQQKPSHQELAFLLNVANLGKLGMDKVPKMSAIPPPKVLLVLGSSVSTGAGARNKETSGWSALLQQTIKPLGYGYWNRGAGGTHVKYWNNALDKPTGVLSNLHNFGVVIMSLSLGNEGLPGKTQKENIARVEEHYVSGLRSIVRKMRSKMLPSARLVLGGPYANDGYKEDHFAALQRVLAEIRSWEEVDHVIDFLQPMCHDGQGHWPKGCSRDAGHPNDSGHQLMFQCVDIDGVLGMTSKM